MKLTDFMLDLATGDASGYDVMIEYDLGKINVSNAVFESCVRVAEMDDNGDYSNPFIQEAAEAGLPDEKNGATAQATVAAGTSVEAFYDLVVDTAKKLKEATTKDWKVIAGLGKKMGVNLADATDGDFSAKFATPLAAKIAGGKSLKLDDKVFVTANFARNFTSNYCNGIAKILAAYGIGMDYDCPVTKNFVGDLSKTSPCAEDTDSCVQQAAQCITHGAKMIKGDGLFSKTANASVKDIAAYITAVYVLKGFSETVVKRAGSASTRKTAISKLNSFMADTNKKGVSHATKNITKTISTRAGAVKEGAETGTKALSDATYAMVTALNGGETPLPKSDK